MSPRQILRRQLERAAERGLRVCSATELEFFLFKDSYEEADAKGWKGLTPHTSTIEDYQLLQTTREEYVLRRIRNEMRGAGIPVEFSKGEAGRGQHEVNVTYDEALVTADHHLVFKNGIKEIAAQEGRAATFMAKWTMDDVGSSCHVHTSLWDAESGDPLMARRRRTRAGCRRSVAASWPASCTRRASWPGAPRRRSTPTGATCPAAGRPPRRSGARTTAPAASASSGTAPGGGWSRGSPGPT